MRWLRVYFLRSARLPAFARLHPAPIRRKSEKTALNQAIIRRLLERRRAEIRRKPSKATGLVAPAQWPFWGEMPPEV